MAFETNSATDEMDLFARLHDFATANGWTAMRYTGYRAVSASSFLGGYEPEKAFDGGAGEWRTAATQIAPAWLALQFVAAIDVRRIALTAPGTQSQAPADFELQYSDDGSIWTAAQSWTGIAWGSAERKTWDIASAGAHLYWRIHATANNGDANYTGLRGWELYEQPLVDTMNRAVTAEMVLKGPGLSGIEEIYIAAKIIYSKTSDIYDLLIAGATGYVDTNDTTAQPGFSGWKGMSLWHAVMPYWLAVNGQRIILAVRVENGYHVVYAGKFLPYATPNQFPYPLAVGGMYDGGALVRYDNTASSIPFKGSRAQFKFRFVDGTWKQPDCWPWNNANNWRDTGGDYPLVPVILNDSGNLYGELDGAYFVPGFAQASENTVAIGAVNYLVLGDVYRTGVRDYWALRMD